MRRALLVLVVINMFFANACSPAYSGPSEDRIIPPTIPMYANMEDFSMNPTQNSSSGTFKAQFMTIDTPDVVLAFYKAHLLEQGWTLPGEDDGYLSISNNEACPTYMLRVNASLEDNKTRVEIELSSNVCTRL